jgi:hypothetical protein
VRLLRRLRPPKQTSLCSGCGRLLIERRRRPCPVCGAINRTVSVHATDSFVIEDTVN